MIVTPLFDRPIEYPRAWSAADFEDLDALAVSLSPRHLAALDRELNRALERGAGVDEIGVGDFPLPEMEAWFADLRQRLLFGAGVALVTNFPVGNYSRNELEIIYWGFGTHLGVGCSQSVMGDKVGHVHDTSDQDVNARAYRNKQKLTLHTDLCDFICMLSVTQAACGGVSRYASALGIHNFLRVHQRRSLEILYRGFHMYRLGEHGPGESECTPWRVPVFSNLEGTVSCRWVRFYIEAAANLLESPLTDEEFEALEVLDAAAEREGTVFERLLAPGELSITNNYTVLHSRSAFEDDKGTSARRLLYRLWLNSDDAPPVVPEIDLFAERGIPHQAGQRPSGEGELLRSMVDKGRARA
ncbi:MAG: hypothetical protein CMO26_10975 [Thiotrichales bacterium]|nr:hypothetical protein [Thiotrichales bacterium]